MKVNILVDFKENGLDKNEPHIVMGAENETAAAAMLKASLERKSYDVQAMCAVEGDYTLAELHDMAYYGIGLNPKKCKFLYISEEMMEYTHRLQCDPVEMEKVRKEIERRILSR